MKLLRATGNDIQFAFPQGNTVKVTPEGIKFPSPALSQEQADYLLKVIPAYVEVAEIEESVAETVVIEPTEGVPAETPVETPAEGEPAVEGEAPTEAPTEAPAEAPKTTKKSK